MVFNFDLLFIVPSLYTCLPYRKFDLRLNLCHVDPGNMKQFKELIRKYSHASYLRGSELSTLTGFHHNIPLETPLQFIVYLTGKVPQNWQPLKMSYKTC